MAVGIENSVLSFIVCLLINGHINGVYSVPGITLETAVSYQKVDIQLLSNVGSEREVSTTSRHAAS